MNREPFSDIRAPHPLQQVLELNVKEIGFVCRCELFPEELRLSIAEEGVVRVTSVLCLEPRIATCLQHVQEGSQREYIRLVGIVAHLRAHLRRHVGLTAFGVVVFLSFQVRNGKAPINQLQVEGLVEANILSLDVSVGETMLNHVLDATENL